MEQEVAMELGKKRRNNIERPGPYATGGRTEILLTPSGRDWADMSPIEATANFKPSHELWILTRLVETRSSLIMGGLKLIGRGLKTAGGGQIWTLAELIRVAKPTGA